MFQLHFLRFGYSNRMGLSMTYSYRRAVSTFSAERRGLMGLLVGEWVGGWVGWYVGEWFRVCGWWPVFFSVIVFCPLYMPRPGILEHTTAYTRARPMVTLRPAHGVP